VYIYNVHRKPEEGHIKTGCTKTTCPVPPVILFEPTETQSLYKLGTTDSTCMYGVRSSRIHRSCTVLGVLNKFGR
jgi:hypothetical protein